MKTVTRIINGKLEEVLVYNEMEYEAHIAKLEYETAERRNRELGNYISENLAKNKDFIQAIAKAILDAPIKEV